MNIEWKDVVPVTFDKDEEPYISPNGEHREIGIFKMEGDDYGADFTIFENINFTDDFTLDNVNLSKGLEFRRCDFRKAFLILNSDTYRDLLLKGELTFDSCTFWGDFTIKGNRDRKSRLGESILINACRFYRSVIIGYVEIDTLRFYSSTILYSLRLSNIDTQQIGLFKMDNLNGLNIAKLTGSLFFSQVSILQSFHFDQQNCNEIRFDDCTFNDFVMLTLINSDQECKIFIISSSFKQHCRIHLTDGALPSNVELYLYGLNLTSGLSIMPERSNWPILKKLVINLTNSANGEINIAKVYLKSIELTGVNSNCNVTIDTIKVVKLLMVNFINNAGLRLINIYPATIIENPKSTLKINNTQLGKAFFSNIDLEKFNNVEIVGVNISSINTSLINWFDPEKLNSDRLKKINFRIMRLGIKRRLSFRWSNISPNVVEDIRRFHSVNAEVFRQLKTASQAEGNVPQSLEFQRHEMNSYRLQIKNHKRLLISRTPTICEVSKRRKRMSERLILLSNQTNDFGQNWIRAFWFLMLGGLLTSMPVSFFSSDNLDYSKLANDWNDFWPNFHAFFSLKKYLILFNPTHRIAELRGDEKALPSLLYVFDLLSRVVVSYFLFQMVSAFRKLNKS